VSDTASRSAQHSKTGVYQSSVLVQWRIFIVEGNKVMFPRCCADNDRRTANDSVQKNASKSSLKACQLRRRTRRVSCWSSSRFSDIGLENEKMYSHRTKQIHGILLNDIIVQTRPAILWPKDNILDYVSFITFLLRFSQYLRLFLSIDVYFRLFDCVKYHGLFTVIWTVSLMYFIYIFYLCTSCL